MATIIALQDDTHGGDNENAHGVGNAIAARHAIAERFDFPITADIAVLKQHVSQQAHEPIFVVGAGEQTLPMLNQISNTPNITTIWSGHQIAPKTIEQLEQLNVVHLPEHEVTGGIKHRLQGNLVTSAHGVAHTKTTKGFEQAFRNSPLASSNKPVISVILSGDALNKEGHIQRYTEEEAYALGNYVGDLARVRDADVLATNSCRTGSYAADGQKTYLHQSPDQPLDSVSEAFLQGLASRLPPQNIQFFNHNKAEPSMYEPLIGAAIERGGLIFVPGESVSMLEEITDNVDAEHIISYTTGSMNPSHMKNHQALVSEGKVAELDFQQGVYRPPNMHSEDTSTRLADQIAETADLVQQNRQVQRSTHLSAMR